MIVELAAAPGEMQYIWASFNNKPALMRAYKFTTLEEGNGDAYVQRKEFVALLRNLFFFNKLWGFFDEFDVEDDRRINGQEFQAGLQSMGFTLSQQDIVSTFNEIDENNGGQILFDEFCAYCIKVTWENSVESPLLTLASRLLCIGIRCR
jgi:Ca2+-binding EF-hand superfamily protein